MTGTPGSPRRDGRILEAANYPSRFEAGIALDLLRESGIEAMGKFGDAEGWAPHFALVDGYRVFVFEDELDEARALLAAAESDGVLPSRN